MNTLFLAILFFLLFSFAAKTSSSSPSAITDDPVFDINGDHLHDPKCPVPCIPFTSMTDNEGTQLQPNKFSYYIVAAEGIESGHGVRPCSNKGQECLVVLDKENTKYATAFKFSAETRCKLSIEFKETINKCTGQTVWTDVPNVIPIPEAECLLGCKGKVSTTSSTWFQFVKDGRYEYAYRIIYFKNDNCFNVSHVPNYNKQYLALSKTLDPLVVQFKKAELLNPVLKNISNEMPTVLSVA